MCSISPFRKCKEFRVMALPAAGNTYHAMQSFSIVLKPMEVAHTNLKDIGLILFFLKNRKT